MATDAPYEINARHFARFCVGRTPRVFPSGAPFGAIKRGDVNLPPLPTPRRMSGRRAVALLFALIAMWGGLFASVAQAGGALLGDGTACHPLINQSEAAFWRCVRSQAVNASRLSLPHLGLSAVHLEAAAAARSAVTYVDLRGNRLSEFPVDLLLFGSMAILDLRDNDISSVPREVEAHMRLQKSPLVLLM